MSGDEHQNIFQRWTEFYGINCTVEAGNDLIAAFQAEAKRLVPMPEDELAALIERNEKRKQIKAAITEGPWYAHSESQDGRSEYDPSLEWLTISPYEDDGSDGFIFCEATQALSETDIANFDFIAHARNDRPEDDIDQLLALVADLQAALLEQTGNTL